MATDWSGVIAVGSLLLGGGGVGAFVRAKAPKGDRENKFIDQLQEAQAEDRRRIGQLEDRERLRDDYIQELRQHIADGKPPPPPPYPAALTGSPS